MRATFGILCSADRPDSDIDGAFPDLTMLCSIDNLTNYTTCLFDCLPRQDHHVLLSPKGLTRSTQSNFVGSW
jgi:hypothetical protein